MHKHAQQTVYAADRLQAMEHPADRAAYRAQDDGENESKEHAEHRCEMQKLLHLSRVLIVKTKHGQQRAEEKDLRHQRLDHSALETGDQRDHQYKDDDYVDDHGSGSILEDGYAASPR